MALLALGLTSWLIRKLTRPHLVITRMYIHPIKSCGGIEVKQAYCDQFGLQYDRQWIVVDKDNKPINQKINPKLALVKPVINEGLGILVVTAPGMPELQLLLQPPSNDAIPITVGRTNTEGIDVGEQAGIWFSKFLGIEGCKLLAQIPGLKPRNVQDDVKYTGVYKHPDQVYYNDNTPLSLLLEESLWNLNYNLDKPLPIEQFRMSIVVSGGPAFYEDEIDTWAIGAMTFHHCKQCARCIMTTIDQKTSEKDAASQPLRALRHYRSHMTDDRYPGAPFFGINFAPDAGMSGLIKVGDTLVIKSHREIYPLGERA